MPDAVNPAHDDGRRTLTYPEYLQLDKILTAQRPSSSAPDERPFIVIHQWFELCFKLMLFDFVVIERTLQEISSRDSDNEFVVACTSSDAPIWVPARSAAKRLVKCCALFAGFFNLIRGEGLHESEPSRNSHGTATPERDYTFRVKEFHERFRDNLPPASGFQSKQFRLLQYAFAKAPIFELAFFNARDYHWNYAGEKDRNEFVSVTAPIIFGGSGVALDPPLERVPFIADTVCDVLDRLGEKWNIPAEPSLARWPTENSYHEVRTTYREMVAGLGGEEADKQAERFVEDVKRVVLQEQQRLTLDRFHRARATYARVARDFAGSGLHRCVENLRAADIAFSRFLMSHRSVASDAGLKENDQGSAGGGMPFLAVSKAVESLFPMFRALEQKSP
jgi:hypothetical protein